jgi:hypothetical protein
VRCDQELFNEGPMDSGQPLLFAVEFTRFQQRLASGTVPEKISDRQGTSSRGMTLSVDFRAHLRFRVTRKSGITPHPNVFEKLAGLKFSHLPVCGLRR